MTRRGPFLPGFFVFQVSQRFWTTAKPPTSCPEYRPKVSRQQNVYRHPMDLILVHFSLQVSLYQPRLYLTNPTHSIASWLSAHLPSSHFWALFWIGFRDKKCCSIDRRFFDLFFCHGAFTERFRCVLQDLSHHFLHEIIIFCFHKFDLRPFHPKNPYFVHFASQEQFRKRLILENMWKNY